MALSETPSNRANKSHRRVFRRIVALKYKEQFSEGISKKDVPANVWMQYAKKS